MVKFEQAQPPIPKYAPVTVTFETEEELEAFYHWLNYAGNYRNSHYLPEGEYHMTFQEYDDIRELLYRAFSAKFPNYYDDVACAPHPKKDC